MKGGDLLKKSIKFLVKVLISLFIMIATSISLYSSYTGTFDPVKMIQQLKDENRRDDALDTVEFFKENRIGDTNIIKELEKELEYTAFEKAKSFTWNGAIKGEVYDTYSGLGAISSDLIIVGDLRDLLIQGWKKLTDQDYDKVILTLSTAGIGLSVSPFVIDGLTAFTKTTAKYLKRIPDGINKGVLKRFTKGRLTLKENEDVWRLLKKRIQYPTNHILSFKH